MTEMRLTDTPTGAALRRFNAAVADARTGAGIWGVIGDAVSVLVYAAVGAGLAIGAADQFRATVDTSGAALFPPLFAADPAVFLVLAGLAVLGATITVARRLGPIGMPAPEATWWLPLPIPRSEFLRPTLARVAVLGVLVVGAVGGFGGYALVDASRVTAAGAGALLGAATGTAVVGLSALTQTTAPRRALTGLIGAGILVAVAAGLAVGQRGGAVASAVAAGVVGVVGMVAVVAAARRLDLVPGADLRRRGAVAGHALTAVVSLDTRELGRALADAHTGSARGRSAEFGWVRGGWSAIAAADAALLRRRPDRLVALGVLALLPTLVNGVDTLRSPLVVGLVLIAAGYAAAVSTAEGARRAEMAPVLDRLLPLSQRDTRRARLLVPLAACALWSAVAYGLLTARSPDVPQWVALGVATAPVMAGAALRSAYRQPPEWGGPLVATPAGALPPGVLAVMAVGPDAYLLGLIPTYVALGVGVASWPLIAVQLALGVVVALAGAQTGGT